MAAPVYEIFPPEGPPAVEEAPVEVLPAPSNPLAVARVLLDDPDLFDGEHLLLRYWRGDWWQYQGPHWTIAEPVAVRKWLYMRLEHAQYSAPNRDGEFEQKPWAPDKGKLDKVLDAMTAPTLLPGDVDAPSWVSTGERANGIVPCTNGLVDVETGELRPITPDYFGTVRIPIEYDVDATEPVEWLKFLRTLWPVLEDGTDAEELLALQEWFGYVLSGDTNLQKMLLLVGPPRCGKGTIARILTALLGKPNVAAPTLAGMATNFGLEPLLGKTLGIVGDARLQSQGQETVVERLLSITGEDAITVDRKNRTGWTGTMSARMMILSNELPKFGDASGAVASRFVILTLRESFLGREDIDLDSRLRAELPQILKWALQGLDRLRERKRITEPAASLEAVQTLADLVSPIRQFLREVCVIDPAAATPFSVVYREYGEWCRENGRGVKNTAGLSSDLHTALPEVKTDHRPKIQGQRQPRHVKGLAISAEWTGRVRDTDGERWKVRDQENGWDKQEPPAGW